MTTAGEVAAAAAAGAAAAAEEAKLQAAEEAELQAAEVLLEQGKCTSVQRSTSVQKSYFV